MVPPAHGWRLFPMSERYFWAKTLPDGRPGISVFEHMLNVGCVAQCLAALSPGLLERFQVHAELVGALAALHDLGKISPGFQRKCEAWLVENGLVDLDRQCSWPDSLEGNHAGVTQEALELLLPNGLGVDGKSSRCLAALLGAHHGRIQKDPSRPYLKNGIPPKPSTEARSGIAWVNERQTAGEAVIDHFGVRDAGLEIDSESPLLWWLAGLTTVADWIGSDERNFPPEGGMAEEVRMPQAHRTIESIGFGRPDVVPNLDFAALFGFPCGSQPNDMQVNAREQIRGPGVYVIEAPMGMGKTEAALWAAYELMVAGKASGVYFALPTQATSNRIHLRLNEFVQRIAPSAGASRLIHGNSWLVQGQAFTPAATGHARAEDARVGGEWFASAKRALLAPFGVGTVDQALLGVVAAKHFFVRHFALAGKVVILDEVHSYDLYTGTLIDRLVTVLKGLGCTVIILSATLTAKRRAQMVSLGSDQDSDPASLPYPLISSAGEGEESQAVAAAAPASRLVRVDFQAASDAVDRALRLAAAGGVVLWICNTVGAAQEQYQSLARSAEEKFLVGLLHSRFPFWRREELENEWMERLGKMGDTRCGCILVSTQIVEQSVDLDADLLVTELAPTDMLLQRMGRLWRHDRPGRAGEPEMIVLEESESLDRFRQMDANEIVSALGPKAFVYSPYVLLRSLEVWKASSEVAIPDQIRSRIEATYEERFEGEEPESWQALFAEMYGKVCAYKMKALQSSNIWTVALDDEEGVQTRLNEIPTVQLVLCALVDGSRCKFLDGTSQVFEKEVFQLLCAQAVHKNMVKVPRHLFDTVVATPLLESYLHGEFTVGVVKRSEIEVHGLRKGVRLRWSLEEGVIIEKDSKRSQE
jgi:CRISPR-associated endonuclease/helicase Cas3